MIILYLIIFIFTLINQDLSKEIIINTSITFFSTIYPILFPSIFLLYLINNNYYYQLLLIKIYPLFKKLFNISSPISLGLIISSILIGAPSSTILIINAIKNNQISKNEGYNIIYSFSMLSISYSIFILNKFNISILYLIIYILLSIIYFRIINKINSEYKFSPIKNKAILIIKDGIYSAFRAIFSILGMCIFFRYLLMLIPIKTLNSYIEILIGLNELNNINLDLEIKKIIVISSLIFTGLSVIFQILSIDDDISIIKLIKNKLIIMIFIVLFFLFNSCFFT